MLRIKPAVPVHFAVIELEDTIFFSDLNIHIVRARQNLVRESSVYRSRRVVVDGVGLINDGADSGVFVQQDGSDEVLVREVLGTEV